MLTYAPTPQLRDLKSLLIPALSNQELTSAWRQEGDTTFWFSKSAWALATLSQAWKNKHAGQAPEVWVPAYFCNQSLWPTRQVGCKIRFYPVTEELEPDWESLKNLVKISRPNLFLLTHFFGQENPPQPAREFCDQVDALLIEDGAHVLKPFHQIGQLADFTFYSLHKLLSIPDGSLLVMRPRSSQYQRFLQDAQAQMGEHFASPWKWLGKRWMQKYIPNSLGRYREKRNPVQFDDNSVADEMPAVFLPSSLSQKLLMIQIKDLPQIAKTRQSNESIYQHLLKPVPGCQPWPKKSHPDRVPYYAVFRCESKNLAKDYFQRLRNQGLIVQTWPDLAPEVLHNPKDFATALHLRSTLLTFPVHQSLRPQDIQLYRPTWL
jgi:dTDP-4-amino-4,6-dideoxygalactose transaminase